MGPDWRTKRSLDGERGRGGRGVVVAAAGRGGREMVVAAEVVAVTGD